MEGNKLRLGDLRFPTINTGARLPQQSAGENKQVPLRRFAQSQVFGLPMTSANSFTQQNCDIDLKVSTRQIIIQSTFVYCYLSTGVGGQLLPVYDSISLVLMYPLTSDSNGQVRLDPFSEKDLQVPAYVNDTNQVRISCLILNGGVQRETGVTLGAGMDITFSITIGYEY